MFWIKIIISGLVVASVSELAKRYSVMAGLLASLPLLSILSITWLYIETGDSLKVSALTTNILWAIIPSLTFFIALPLLLKLQMNFYWALAVSCILTFAAYSAYMVLIKKFHLI